MRIGNQFTENTFDFFEHKIEIKENHFLTLEIEKAPFEHITLNIVNPKGECLYVLTFKTRIQHFKLYKNLCSGEWSIKIIRTYPIALDRIKEYSVEINQIPVEKLSEYHDYYSIRSAWTDTNKFTDNTEKYYSGDIHLHTNFSDGRMSENDLLDITRLRGLDFLAPTDHNIWTPLDTTLPIIPALEYTPDDFGHFNIYGISENLPFISMYEQSQNLTEALEYLLEYANKHNLTISANHPFCSMCPSARDFDLKSIHLLEVINSPSNDSDIIKNNYALQAFDFLWQHGYKIFGVGGSDAHRAIVNGKVRPGNPTIHVYATNNSPKNILQGIRNGSSYLTSNIDLDLKILHQNKEVLPGSELLGEVLWHISSPNLLHWNLIKNGGIITSIVEKKCVIKSHIEKGDYIRLEGRSEKGEIKVFINPLYHSLKGKTTLTWFDVLDNIGHNTRAI